MKSELEKDDVSSESSYEEKAKGSGRLRNDDRWTRVNDSDADVDETLEKMIYVDVDVDDARHGVDYDGHYDSCP